MSTTKTKNLSGRRRRRFLGTLARPRLSVFRSNRGLYAQLINDETGETLVGLRSGLGAATRTATKLAPTKRAEDMGRELAGLARSKKIKQVVFDRGAYRYAGRVRALAEGARAGGLLF